MTDRQKRLLDTLTDQGRVEVSALAGLLGVSQVTVRKDLDALGKLGLIRREHGTAVLGSSDDLNSRLAYHYEQKKRIAKLAAACVQPGETVFIESGSCCALLAEELALSGLGVTIVTNSAFIAGFLRAAPGAKVVLLGGSYQASSQVLVGPLVRTCAGQFFVDKLFVGTDGFSPASGFTGSDMMRAEAVRAMRRQANRAIVLTESRKFVSQGVVPLLEVREVSAVYTDGGIPEETERYLLDRGVAVLKA